MSSGQRSLPLGLWLPGVGNVHVLGVVSGSSFGGVHWLVCWPRPTVGCCLCPSSAFQVRWCCPRFQRRKPALRIKQSWGPDLNLLPPEHDFLLPPPCSRVNPHRGGWAPGCGDVQSMLPGGSWLSAGFGSASGGRQVKRTRLRLSHGVPWRGWWEAPFHMCWEQ